jgi:aminoglycoside 6'-N-acetyltransferase I
MEIVDLATQPEHIREQAAAILSEAFPDADGWPTVQSGSDEIARISREGFVRASIDDGSVLGWIGGLPEYHGRVWELHPIVVAKDQRLHGVGRVLVGVFEDEARRRGALTATLGTDDLDGMTSLSQSDLYGDLPGHIARLHDLGRRHPFLFYRKLGYVVTGVMPDANGRGRPDIYMSKAL